MRTAKGATWRVDEYLTVLILILDSSAAVFFEDPVLILILDSSTVVFFEDPTLHHNGTWKAQQISKLS